ncbi:AraC family transcriptional regulator [Paenibacillus tundrae]|uniref:AraC family transcriptional regulator n=1 Tax=Paenibacillus tundrae TaxID=528187 RepID=UPI0030D41005
MQSVNDMKRASMGILKFNEIEATYQLNRYAPSEALRAWVKHFWVVSWDLTGKQPYSQHIVPNPCVNLIVERGNTFFYGPSKHKFTYMIKDKGSVFGVKFKPGGCYPYLRTPISALHGNPLHVGRILNVTSDELEDYLLGMKTDAEKVSYMDQLLCEHIPAGDAKAQFVGEIVSQIELNRDMLRVDDLAAYWNIHTRQLQRLFNQYVGLSPKAVIKLYRLQNAAESIEQGSHYDLIQLSQDLGYHDQSHFIKDFKSIIGSTPEDYVNNHSKN